MSIQRAFLLGLFLACLPLATQAAERNGAAASKSRAVRKAAAPLLSGKPIEPAEAPAEEPRAGWGGAYVGVNAGAAANDANR